MNLWEAWYLNYEASEAIDDELFNDLSLWSARFAQYFTLGGYVRGQSSLPILPHEALSIIGFLYQDDVDIDELLDMVEEFCSADEIQIPILWLSDPQQMARIHTSWAHDILHDSENENFFLNPRDDLPSLPPDDQICWLLDSAEFILELGEYLDESDRVRLDTWAKLLYADKMMQVSEPLVAGQAGVALIAEEEQQRPPLGDGTLVYALTHLCRADRLEAGHTLVQGPAISESQAQALADELQLSPADEQALIQVLESLFMHLDDDQVSSTYLSDTQQWLEGMLFLAQALLAQHELDEQPADTVLPELENRLDLATDLVRLGHRLSADQQDLIRQWALSCF